MPFELRPYPAPTLTPEGDYLKKAWAERVYPLAERLGVEIRLPEVSPQPHTHIAHEGTLFAKEKGRANEFSHSVFSAIFQLSRDIGDAVVLTDIAENVGLDAMLFKRVVLEERHYSAERKRLEQNAHELGIHAVPTFFIGEQVLQGLYPQEVLEEVINKELSRAA